MERTSPLQILAEAFRDVHRNPGPLFLYLAITVGMSIGLAVLQYVVKRLGIEESLPAVSQSIGFVRDIVLALGDAVAASIAFSRLGRELDKPLWKIEGDWEALRRFFLPWFILSLGFVAVIQLLRAAVGSDAASGAVVAADVGVIVLAACIVPLGACIMFHGRLDWREIPESLSPLAKQFPLALVFFLLGFVVFGLLGDIHVLLARSLDVRNSAVAPVIEVLDGYFECVIFAGIWEICRISRDMIEEHDIEF